MLAPHLIVIGAQKSGTTWLQHVLDTNDHFYCPSIRQEVSFFTNYWDEGMEYYHGLYKDAKPNQVTVDVSPRYQEILTTPERIVQFQNTTQRKIKLILICREPVARLESAYKMYIKQGYEYDNLNHAITKTPDLIEKGLYAKTLKHYYQFFDPKDVLVLFFDNLKSDSASLLKRVQNFVDSSEAIINTYEKVKINSGGKKKSKLVSEVLRYSGRSLRALGLSNIIHKIKKTSVVRKVRELNEEPFDITEEDKLFLKDLAIHFQKDLEELKDISNNEKLINKWLSNSFQPK